MSFFLKIKSVFKHIFLIGRDGKLYPVRDYAHLRIMMLAGYPVEDLMCCQIVPSAVRDLIAPGFRTPGHIPLLALSPADRNGVAIAYNRGEDGWTYPSPDSPGSRSGLIFSLGEPMSIRLDVPAVHAGASGFQSHSLLIVVGDRDYTVDILDRSASLDLHLPIGVTYVFAETDHAFRADSYFGNPGDHRQLGARLNLPNFEVVM